MTVKKYSELIAWQKAMDLVEMVYRTTTCFPKEELYGLTIQVRRAVISIPSNIAEGQARRTTRDFLYFLSVANGSLREVETQVIIAQRLNYIKEETKTRLLDLASEVGRLISGLTKALNSKSTNH